MGVDMSTNPPPNPHPFVPSPALSLTLAGIFRWGADVDGGDDAMEVTSENSGPARSRSDHEEMVHHNADVDDGDDDGGDDSGDEMKGKTNKRRKKSHRHSADQIREMEALFKESPHPDEKQRQQLSKQLGLHPRQVKFWFQNRRTQIKAIQERHENSLLKTQLEKLKHENKSLRDTIQRGGCPNCGFAVGGTGSSKEMINIAVGDDQQLKIENSRLKVEVERLKAMVSKAPAASSSPTASSKATNDQHDRSCLDSYTGSFGIEKSKIMDIVDKALEELKKMATSGEPLWLRSIETGREILNYDHYIKEFSVGCSNDQPTMRSIEASRESRVVFVDLPRLVQSFMDVNQWREMFPFLISKAAMVDVINVGEGPNRNGVVQLIFAELQMLTPMVPTREVYFVRYCKRLSPEKWAIVDVSIDKIEDSIDASLVRCRKRPSGCIIEDTSNGHCKVTWVEHLKCQKVTVHSMYRTIVNSGLAFGASHWMATLQLQCERLAFLMATNVPNKDSSGVGTLAGRKSVLKLAQRMTWSFCQAVGASSFNSWTKMTTKTGEDVRVASRKNLNDPGEPIGTIICAVSSAWLPVSPSVLFNFLRDEALRHKWDVMAGKSQVQSIANLAKGQDRGNAVCIQMMNSNENTIWLLQDSCTNSYESLVVYSPVDISGMESVMTGCDSGNVVVLPSGFSILSDGMESRPLVLMSRQEDKNAEGGSLLTIALQAITNNSSATTVAVESVEPVSTLISCILQNIRTSLQCEDG